MYKQFYCIDGSDKLENSSSESLKLGREELTMELNEVVSGIEGSKLFGFLDWKDWPEKEKKNKPLTFTHTD